MSQTIKMIDLPSGITVVRFRDQQIHRWFKIENLRGAGYKFETTLDDLPLNEPDKRITVDLRTVTVVKDHSFAFAVFCDQAIAWGTLRDGTNLSLDGSKPVRYIIENALKPYLVK
jgi:hypothetical protein